MKEELAPFRRNAVTTEKKLDFFATADVQLATPGSDSTATRTVSPDGQIKGFSADWQNTEEAPDTHGNLETDLMTMECSEDVRAPMERETAKNMV